MANTKKVATKKVAPTKKVAKPAGKPANGKGISIATFVLGYIGFVMLVVGALLAFKFMDAEGFDMTGIYILCIVSQLVTIAAGALAIVKGKKVDFDNKTRKLMNIILGSITIGFILLLVLGAVLMFAGVEAINEIAMYGLLITVGVSQISVVIIAISNTIWFAKANKGAKKPAAKK